ncbi:unnamed protein product [[Candida] boidinii]|nr:unnamed protein product [[Candida] boidinii]
MDLKRPALNVFLIPPISDEAQFKKVGRAAPPSTLPATVAGRTLIVPAVVLIILDVKDRSQISVQHVLLMPYSTQLNVKWV